MPCGWLRRWRRWARFSAPYHLILLCSQTPLATIEHPSGECKLLKTPTDSRGAGDFIRGCLLHDRDWVEVQGEMISKNGTTYCRVDTVFERVEGYIKKEYLV
jgi:hypothetical protein